MEDNMEEIIKLKAEIFDLMAKRDDLNVEIQEKVNKIRDLEKDVKSS